MLEVNDNRVCTRKSGIPQFGIELMDHQLEAIEQLSTGKILYGATGSGKSAAVLGYYIRKEAPRHIFVITTAKKRDTLDWEGVAAQFGIGTTEDTTVAGIIEVDSWNNMKKYIDVKDAFFIFDEQRLVGSGAWVKSFIKITRNNHWVMLTATPGDTWLDYAPVFIANGFYKNITDFKRNHVLYEPWSSFPRIRMYLNETKLELLRNEILVEMPYIKHTIRHLNYLDVGYDKELMSRITKQRWNVFEDRPVKDAAELYRLQRMIINSDPSRMEMVHWVMKLHPKLIIFYNFDYELEILRTLRDGETEVFEYNGHKKDKLPEGDSWIYLIQYVAGAEAWNCTTTNAMLLYSLTYSYKNFIQVQGRIDRLDTDFVDLFYYILVSDFKIDRGIRGSLGNKKNFNEKRYIREELGHGGSLEKDRRFGQL
jgi:hypothetical protein